MDIARIDSQAEAVLDLDLAATAVDVSNPKERACASL